MAAAGDMYVSPCLPRICVRPRSRILELAKPKTVFHESSPTLVWGNQETIWALSGGAMTARPSARILALSRPKEYFSTYQCRCRPMIGGRTALAKFGYPSERLLRLAEPKKLPTASLVRRSPEWSVSLAAQNYNASKRILELAQPKKVHPDFMPPREVSRSSQKAVASPRTIELSKPKQVHAKYMPPRDPEWPVTQAAKHAVATPRVVELAQPTTRPRMGLTTLNPDAFKVKEAAIKAACSPRIEELARPIQR
ncbi:testicular haploid expressed gene protein-like isoform X2 [Poecile atricapillus]|uniref:testicular haploid expressed gene protein-like isoform X2 n=1 Tax=Poecile atricapillus TaxID=48891 RepID=UPI0027382A1A|nr:testicular haploid expressed gene protein-like isoform X2 [Poecile atricapillus]